MDPNWRIIKDLSEFGLNLNTVIALAILVFVIGPKRVIEGIKAWRSGPEAKVEQKFYLKESPGSPDNQNFVTEKMCDFKHGVIDKRLEKGDAEFQEVRKDIGDIKGTAIENTTLISSIKDTLCGMQDYFNIPVSKRR
jgi:hypothetical protein